MEFFDLGLPVFVDYLGCFEVGINGINTPPDVMKELHDRGVQDNKFLPYGELIIEEDQLVLRDSPQRIVAERYALKDIHDPVAFVRKNVDHGNQDGFTRVVIFLEKKQGGHFGSKERFHAVQCCDSDPIDLVEMIKGGITRDHNPRSRSTSIKNGGGTGSDTASMNSMDSNWLMRGTTELRQHHHHDVIMRQKKVTDSVRSATVRRSATNSNPYLRGTSGTETPPEDLRRGIPVMIPTPHLNAQQQLKKVEKKPADLKIPLVTDQTAGALGFDRPSFQFSISEDPVQKDSIMLNYCIDDIERFCSEIRAKDLPPEIMHRRPSEKSASDFVNIFQKFKLSFNLLGRLEEFMENPTAPEMVHHLFPPLAFLVDECYNEFDEDLVRNVMVPIPTPKAVDFLERTLGEREAVIWRALGENWLDPNARDEREVVPYSPRFHDGWSPGVISFAPPDPPQRKRSDVTVKSNRQSEYSNEDVFPPTTLQRYLSVNSSDSVFDSITNNFDDFRDELMSLNADIALVTCSKDAQNMKELNITKGEYLEVLDNSRNWWRCINANGQSGFVPSTFVKVILYENGENFRQGNSTKQQIRKNSSKKKKPAVVKPAPIIHYESSASDSEVEDMVPTPPAPPAAPIPAPPPQPVHQPAKSIKPSVPKKQQNGNYTSNSSVRSGMSMQEELKSVLDLINNDQKTLDIHTTPDVYINHKSNPKQVRHWLKAKGFSQRAVDQLSKLDGARLFAMSRKDLIAAFGKQEGQRLDSQITISRNSAGYQTARTSELRNVLNKARKRSEFNREKYGDGDEAEISVA